MWVWRRTEEDAVDREEAYAWGEIFASPPERRAERLAARARELGLVQEAQGDALVWMRDGEEITRWVFVPDPGDLERVRAIFADQGHVTSPRCLVVVTQKDEPDTRGDVVFDMFELSPRSYLSHFNRVFTRPLGGQEKSGSR